MVYSVVDLEDGVKKGVIDWIILQQKLEEYAEDKKLLKECFEGAEKIICKEDAVKLEGQAKAEAMSQAFRVVAIKSLVDHTIAVFQDKYDDIMHGDYHGELIFDSKAAPLINACKKVGLKHVYCAEPNLKKEIMGRKVIHGLMDIFWEGALAGAASKKTIPDKKFALTSENYRKVYKYALEQRKLPDKYCKIQLVTDYICGMTDTFACTLHKQLTNG